MAVITISREYGSRGEEIAQQVATELGYSYFDKEILTDVAREVDTTEDKISEHDEKDEHGFRAFLKNLFAPNNPGFAHYPYYPGIAVDVSDEFVNRQLELDANQVTDSFRHVVEKLWERGNVVIVGRGSQKILAAKPDTLHLSFIGKIGVRAETVRAEEHLTREEALEKIQTIDEQRSHYLKRYYDVYWENPRLYHMIINTSLMSIKQAVKVIVAMVHQMKGDG